MPCGNGADKGRDDPPAGHSIGSPEDDHLRETANAVAHELTGSFGYIWTAVGMDFVPCSMNCTFCSFGEKWHVIKESRHVTEEKILESVRRYAA